MKRFHVNVSVADLGKSIDFYTTLFGREPSLVKEDYAKWMLDDPRVASTTSACRSTRKRSSAKSRRACATPKRRRSTRTMRSAAMRSRLRPGCAIPTMSPGRRL